MIDIPYSQDTKGIHIKEIPLNSLQNINNCIAIQLIIFYRNILFWLSFHWESLSCEDLDGAKNKLDILISMSLFGFLFNYDPKYFLYNVLKMFKS